MRWWPFTLRGTGALTLAVVSFVVAGETGVVELMFFGVLMIMLVSASLASLWFRGAPTASPRRVVPDVSTTGKPTKVTITLRPPRRMLGRSAHWREAADPVFAGDLDGDLAWDGTEGSATISYSVTPTSRGTYSLGPLRVITEDPFGLARRAVRVLGAVSVRVAPAQVDVPALRGMTATAGGALHATHTQRGHGVDNLLARPYQPGDSMRRIHWRASAHHDGLMVRQEENESAPDAVVVLDLDRSRWGEGAADAPGKDPAFEAAVATTVSAVAQLSSDGYTVSVLDSDGTALHEPIEPGERVLLDAFAAQCATIVAGSGHSILDLPRAFARVGNGPIVMITGAVSEADIAALAPIGAHTTLPILLATGATPDALDRAGELGWRVQTIRVGPEMPGWWDDAREHDEARARRPKRAGR
ncbi:DUF58 domain-containing protein [Microbacterium sp. bgisy207]|jgi:uncharacterized protein (DUF58 family)|uniref:DUF58 domain-containing protein n=1 Tax=Microbacterium sp. bgisy207 TaxID=3413800 RepID=UPI003EBDEE66